MKLIRIDDHNAQEPASAALIEAYVELIKRKEGFSKDKQITFDFSQNVIFLMVDDNEKLMAGAAIRDGDAYKNDILLPKNDAIRCGHLYYVVAEAGNDLALLPGVTLQTRIFEMLRDGQLILDNHVPLNTLMGPVRLANSLSAYLAAQRVGFTTVVRAHYSVDYMGINCYMSAITSDPSINLVPAGQENDVLPQERLRRILRYDVKTKQGTISLP